MLTDTDLKGRDVITLICQNNLVELLGHPYIEKLADEVWDGPQRVDRSLFRHSTAWRAVKGVFLPSHELSDPLEAPQHTAIQRAPAFGFASWRDGVGIRYFAFVAMQLLLLLLLIYIYLTN